MTPYTIQQLESVFTACPTCGKKFRKSCDRKKFCSKKCYFRSLKGKKKTLKHRRSISNALRGKPHKWCEGKKNVNWRHDVSTGELVRLYKTGFSASALEKLFKMDNVSIKARLRKAGVKIRSKIGRMSGSELLLQKLIRDNNLPFKFTGDGKVWIGKKCPDFMHVRKHKLIELFGRPFHDQTWSKRIVKKIPYHQTVKGCTEYYHNYEVLIIWNYELDQPNLINRLEMFSNGEA